MVESLAERDDGAWDRLRSKLDTVGGSTLEQTAQHFVELLYEPFKGSMVLLRLFVTVNYGALPAADRAFVDQRGIDTGTSHLIQDATPIFTLFGTRGERPEWNDRQMSRHFRCIPVASTAFVASLSMLSRQFESVGLDVGLIDDWQGTVVAGGRADHYRGVLHIPEAGTDRDQHGRMIVPKQDFVADSGVRTVFGLGSGYRRHPTLLTLFVFTNRVLDRSVAEPYLALLELFRDRTEDLVCRGSFFAGEPDPSMA